MEFLDKALLRTDTEIRIKLPVIVLQMFHKVTQRLEMMLKVITTMDTVACVFLAVSVRVPCSQATKETTGWHLFLPVRVVSIEMRSSSKVRMRHPARRQLCRDKVWVTFHFFYLCTCSYSTTVLYSS